MALFEAESRSLSRPRVLTIAPLPSSIAHQVQEERHSWLHQHFPNHQQQQHLQRLQQNYVSPAENQRSLSPPSHAQQHRLPQQQAVKEDEGGEGMGGEEEEEMRTARLQYELAERHAFIGFAPAVSSVAAAPAVPTPPHPAAPAVAAVAPAAAPPPPPAAPAAATATAPTTACVPTTSTAAGAAPLDSHAPAAAAATSVTAPVTIANVPPRTAAAAPAAVSAPVIPPVGSSPYLSAAPSFRTIVDDAVLQLSVISDAPHPSTSDAPDAAAASFPAPLASPTTEPPPASAVAAITAAPVAQLAQGVCGCVRCGSWIHIGALHGGGCAGKQAGTVYTLLCGFCIKCDGQCGVSVAW